MKYKEVVIETNCCKQNNTFLIPEQVSLTSGMEFSFYNFTNEARATICDCGYCEHFRIVEVLETVELDVHKI